MIDGRQLRIGNWFNYYGSYKQIEEGNQIEEASYEGEPIPLTAEILEQCGFVNIGYGGHKNALIYEHTKSKLRISIVYNEVVHYLLDTTDAPVKHYTITLYLHQLQNLYFALTNEELTVNLSTEKPASLSL